MEVNVRMADVMRAIGAGHGPLRRLCCYMNMPEPMNSDNYDNVSRTMKDATQIVAESSMFDAAKELKGDATEIVDASVSIEQKRGFVSS